MEIIEINHIQITVPESSLESAKHFYGAILGLEEIARPEATSRRGGAWYLAGETEVHLSVEDGALSNPESKRHICYMVGDLERAETELREAGIDILPDERPIEGWKRFYVRDPGGNKIEIAELPS